MRKFEKISYTQFKKDIKDDETLYKHYEVPSRSTVNSAGYDFRAIEAFTLKPGENKKIPTGIKVNMNEDEVLFLFVRSSMGFKYNIRMMNQVGVIDADYYNNCDNEGHIWVALQNEGEQEYTVLEGEKICQGVFTKFLTTTNEEKIERERTGGFGSTNKEG